MNWEVTLVYLPFCGCQIVFNWFFGWPVHFLFLTDGKKGGHTDTPHPAKKGKTPATDKSKAQTPKSAGGNFSCGSCSKSFGSDGALQSHNKAKHSAGK